MHIAVVYKSKTGFTYRYAQWIAEALNANLFELKSVSSEQLEHYSTIVYGGSLHAVGINGLKDFRKKLKAGNHQNIILFGVGATPAREDVVPLLIKENLSESEQDRIKMYYLRGGFDFSKLGWFDKLLMQLMKMKIKSKAKSKRTPDEHGMLAAYDHPMDFTNRRYIEPLVSYVRSIEKTV